MYQALRGCAVKSGPSYNFGVEGSGASGHGSRDRRRNVSPELPTLDETTCTFDRQLDESGSITEKLLVDANGTDCKRSRD